VRGELANAMRVLAVLQLCGRRASGRSDPRTEKATYMKAPRFRLRSILIAIALAALVMAFVASKLRGPGRPYSTVFLGLDPVTLFGSQPGYEVKVGTSWNVFNAPRGYAYKEWHGFVTAPRDVSVRQTIKKAIEAYILNMSKGRCHTEGSLTGEPRDAPQIADLPSHELLMFNEGDRHGDLHVWLFSDSSGTAVGYAIFLREEPFDDG
jgi:hypothetical protein